MSVTSIDRRPIIVGVDGSASALRAVRWAAAEAARRRVPLLLMHVCLLAPVRHPRQISPPLEYHEAVLAQGRHWLTEASEAAKASSNEIEVSTDLRAGIVADVLITESISAQLVVLGSRGLGGFTGLLVGSVAVALAAHGHCPIVVLRSDSSPPPTTGPVVVGVDGSALSDAAVAFAFEAADARSVPLVAVHTWRDVAMAGAWTALPFMVDWERVQADEERLLDERLAGWRDKFPQVEVREIVIRDNPVRALLTQSEAGQLIVVGSRGRGAFTGVGLGSVSQSLLHHAACPVAVVRPGRT